MPLQDTNIEALASLNEPMRRRLYSYVVKEGTAVSRESAATALDIARSVAAFHLDKLADLGLLEVEFRRPEGRSGPGAGRPAKFYRRATGEIALSVPDRHYDVAALLLARAVERSAGGSISTTMALREVAREYGHFIGSQSPGREIEPSPVTRLCTLLAEHGYEPRSEGEIVTLANCPFHALAEEHRELVCGMNLELIRGVVEAAGLPDDIARLDPKPEKCCVTLIC